MEGHISSSPCTHVINSIDNLITHALKFVLNILQQILNLRDGENSIYLLLHCLRAKLTYMINSSLFFGSIVVLWIE
jgi:hypothetical protein